MSQLRLKCIGCEVFARPLYLSAARSNNVVDITLIRYGLHTIPAELRHTLQAEIDAVVPEDHYDAVVLAYGLCGKATHGLQAGSLPIVLPRAHDCITLFLGGRERYNQQFDDCPGTYWYVQDFIERSDSKNIPLSIGAFTSGDADRIFAEFVEKYGEDNANYLMEVMEAWQKHYQRAAFIDMGIGVDGGAAKAEEDARRRGWRFEKLTGDLILLKKLLAGDWGEDFLMIKPGERIETADGPGIVRAVSPDNP